MSATPGLRAAVRRHGARGGRGRPTSRRSRPSSATRRRASTTRTSCRCSSGIALGIVRGQLAVLAARGARPGAARASPAGRSSWRSPCRRIGKIGPLVWYMPISANYVLRETGIVLFLAAVGLGAGDVFVETLVHGHGLYWMACGAAITVVPAPRRGRRRPGRPRPELPDPLRPPGRQHDRPAGPRRSRPPSPAREAPSVAYATVYPLTMILRVLSAQLLVMYLVR